MSRARTRTVLFLVALASLFVLADLAWARGGRGGGSGAGNRATGRTNNGRATDRQLRDRRRERDTKKMQQIDREITDEENRQAILRDGLVDSV